jgi:riboflavin synthase
MFSGIVEKTGIIRTLDLKEKWGHIAVETDPWDPSISEGESIANGGICLTLTSQDNGLLHFDVLRETFDKTTLGDRQVGDRINLERSLRWGQTMGGHIVVGHVDGVGVVESITQVGRDWMFEFSCSEEMMDGIVYKGSIGIDGVSLTVAELREKSFCVHIIPYTYEFTTFSDLKKGSRVNLEIDLLGKYVRRLLERGRVLEGVTWESLRETGLIPSEESED